MQIGIVIVAAGRGERAGIEDGPKQYRRIGGRAVIAHTLEVFLTWYRAASVVAVIHPEDRDLLVQAIAGLPGADRVTIAIGGATRQQSVLSGLEAIVPTEATHVMIHDAARPFIDHALLERIAARLDGGDEAVLPALPVFDTLMRSTGGTVEGTVSREGLFAAQTPQTFRLPAILQAHRDAEGAGFNAFTADCSIAEWAGI